MGGRASYDMDRDRFADERAGHVPARGDEHGRRDWEDDRERDAWQGAERGEWRQEAYEEFSSPTSSHYFDKERGDYRDRRDDERDDDGPSSRRGFSDIEPRRREARDDRERGQQWGTPYGTRSRYEEEGEPRRSQPGRNLAGKRAGRRRGVASRGKRASKRVRRTSTSRRARGSR